MPSLSKSAFTKRVISAIIAGLVLFGAYFLFNNSGLIFMVYVAGILSAFEYSRMMFLVNSNSKPLGYLFLIFVFIFYSTSNVHFIPRFEFGMALISLYLTIAIALFGSRKENHELLILLNRSILGFAYVVWLPLFCVNLLRLPNGNSWFLWLLLVVFIGDTMAYFGGKIFGKTALSPKLSPKKTLEGAIVGLIGSCLASSIFCFYTNPSSLQIYFIIFGLIAGLVAQAGDLFESLIKRVANVKDSGNIMPGHGGALDRIDGILFASPIVYLFAFYAERFLIYSQ
jgi:phosphatidate cytidylyltransferase